MLKKNLIAVPFLAAFFLSCTAMNATGQVREERLGVLGFGLNDGIQNTEIFRYASREPQGMAIVHLRGKDRLYVTVRASSSNAPDKGQACRITEFHFRADGSLDPRPVCFSKVLPIGHGQGIGALKKGEELYFYCQSSYVPDRHKRYKGVTVVHWREGATSPSDVTEIPLIPPTGELSRYGFLTPTISKDGKYLIALCFSSHGARLCCIWDLAKLTPFAKPVRTFPVRPGIAKGDDWQGLCADSRHIYFVHGGLSSLKRHAIAVYDYRGHLVTEYLIQDEKAVFGGEEGILRWQGGVPWNIELEGIDIYKKDLVVLGICNIYADGDIVSWKGNNYVCLRSTDGTILPSDSNYWMLTKKAAISGEFTNGTRYLSGQKRLKTKKRYIDKYKFLYKIVGGRL